jgi:hypothetical protein
MLLLLRKDQYFKYSFSHRNDNNSRKNIIIWFYMCVWRCWLNISQPPAHVTISAPPVGCIHGIWLYSRSPPHALKTTALHSNHLERSTIGKWVKWGIWWQKILNRACGAATPLFMNSTEEWNAILHEIYQWMHLHSSHDFINALKITAPPHYSWNWHKNVFPFMKLIDEWISIPQIISWMHWNCGAAALFMNNSTEE